MSIMSLRQNGIALILVLWVLVLLSVIAGSMAMTQRSGVAMVSNIKNERQGRALVAAGINYMALHLKQRGLAAEEKPFPVDGRLHPWQFAGETVWIGASSDSARINLNMADEKLLLSMLMAAGLEEEEAIPIRDAIMDWRDKDDAHRIEGAEDDAYEADGRALGARDGLFLSVEELQQVLGITPELYKRLAPLLTVHSKQRTVDPTAAGDSVLLSVPGMFPADVAQYKEERDQALAQGLPVPMPTVGGTAYFSKGRGTVYRVFAEVDRVDGKKIQGEVVLNSGKKTKKGYMIMEKNYVPLSNLGRVALSEE